MDTNRLKRFACEARGILMSGVRRRLTALGFYPDGTVAEKPELMGGGAVFMGEVQTEDFYHKWMSLYDRVQGHSFREVAEEAAYTWFNRLTAIRIMVKNGLIPAVLEYESGEARIPVIVAEARQGRLPQMDEAGRRKLEVLLRNDALTDEQFALLIVAYCHSNPVIRKCFGSISDYTELLLPSNILKSEGFIDRLNADEYITAEDYRSPELIGWLYQFYISERKDEVFAKKGKLEADEIPAATQIFTPNWIVRYMVQNTVGRIWLDNNPYSDIKEGMEYLAEPAGPAPADGICRLDDICDLKVADLACGSGHILNECFDLLYRIYIEEGYNRRQAVENIFRHNLTGIDIDTRAKQLAAFALLMKACQKDKSFADGRCMPRVLDMPQPYPHTENLCDTLPRFLLGGNQNMIQEITDAIKLMHHADTLGSVMKFNISESTRNAIRMRMEEYKALEFVPEPIRMLLPYMDMILALTDKYAAVVMNPPYMGSGNMNDVLGRYVKKNYPESKADLFSVFMDIAVSLLSDNGKYGMINMHSWMFLSSFENLRKTLLDNYHIENMLHLGPRTFDELSGEVVQNTVFVVAKHAGQVGTYFRLVDGKDCGDKERIFLEALAEHTPKIYYPDIRQDSFKKIPGCPIGYWVSNNFINSFASYPHMESIAKPHSGLGTGNTEKFLRLWFEVPFLKINESFKRTKKWIKYNKGGVFRRWYGNLEYVVNWENEGEEMKQGSGFRSCAFESYDSQNFAWSNMFSGKISIRYFPKGIMQDSSAYAATIKKGYEDSFLYLIGFFNTKILDEYKRLLNTTMHFVANDFRNVPLIYKANQEIDNFVQDCIDISRLDWDAHETSWDFRRNELLGFDAGSIEERVGQYKQKWEALFMRLHANEEELNRRFIDIYGLQDELTPDVPLNEVTILQQGEITIENGRLVWHDDVIIKQLVSYAVGCMTGRYSLDREGLILANQGDGKAGYEALVPHSRFAIDDDGIIPLMSVNNELTDHITLRFKAWLGVAFGRETLTENLNFVEKALGKRIEDYFLKDFWKDHKRMYQNRPVYWLFSSKKGAFQCLVYMHRMDAYTAEKVRTRYLLPHIEWLVTRQAEMQADAASLSARERRETDALGKQTEECREYHDRLHVVADRQIGFDLDDGVAANYAKLGDVLVKLK